jgi:hypothetical protein
LHLKNIQRFSWQVNCVQNHFSNVVVQCHTLWIFYIGILANVVVQGGQIKLVHLDVYGLNTKTTGSKQWSPRISKPYCHHYPTKNPTLKLISHHLPNSPQPKPKVTFVQRKWTKFKSHLSLWTSQYNILTYIFSALTYPPTFLATCLPKY